VKVASVVVASVVVANAVSVLREESERSDPRVRRESERKEGHAPRGRESGRSEPHVRRESERKEGHAPRGRESGRSEPHVRRESERKEGHAPRGRESERSDPRVRRESERSDPRVRRESERKEDHAHRESAGHAHRIKLLLQLRRRPRKLALPPPLRLRHPQRPIPQPLSKPRVNRDGMYSVRRRTSRCYWHRHVQNIAASIAGA
jgi:hypothetical protein